MMTSSVSVSNATGTVAEDRIGLSSGLPNHASGGTTTRAASTHPHHCMSAVHERIFGLLMAESVTGGEARRLITAAAAALRKG